MRKSSITFMMITLKSRIKRTMNLMITTATICMDGDDGACDITVMVVTLKSTIKVMAMSTKMTTKVTITLTMSLTMLIL